MSENEVKITPFKKYSGFILLFLSAFLSIAMISYMFTWKSDQDTVTMNLFKYLTNSQIVADNIFGKFGAFFAHLLMYQGIGISALLLSFSTGIIGLYLLTSIWVIAPARLFKNVFFWLVFISTFGGFFFTDQYGWIGGMFGFYTSHLLANWTGNIGFVCMMLFVLFVFLSIKFNWNFTSFLQALLTPSPKTEKVEKKEAPKPVLGEEIPISNSVREHRLEEVAPYTTERHTQFGAIELKEKEGPIELTQEEEEETEEEGIENEEQDIDLEIEVHQTEEDLPEPINSSDDEEIPTLIQDPYDPTLDLSSFQMPELDLLKDYGDTEININREELEENKNKIVKTLGNYSIEISKIKATVGPTVTLYEIIPAPGVRISKIKNLEDDIALSLSALGIRIIAPIPGKGTVGIEVPNQNPELVGMRTILSSERFTQAKMDLPIALGKTISNETYVADLAKMPHLLMAGATGQGKSVGLNAILISLLYKKHPSQIKFILVDPKKVELTLFNKLERHYLAKLPGTEESIITDTKKVVNTLNSLCIEMDHRYELLKDAQVRTIKEYNAKFVERKLNPEHGHKFLPYIILVIDEFADLIMTAGKEIETPIARLAQLARAIGIHLIIATQRPSVNIITGTIKANFPSRIAFRVTSKVDSRTILDSGGADQLIGKGDMLVSFGSDLVRIQCAFVDTPEVEKITDFIGSQRGYPDAFLLPEYQDEKEEKEEFSLEDRDQMFDEAAKIIVTHQQGSASLLQRKLKLGYNRAGRIVDQLEAAGIIGPFEGSKPRQVLYSDLESLAQFLQSLKKDPS